MNSLKAKIALVLFVLATLVAFPVETRADGNPFPTCGNHICMPLP